MQWIKTHLNIVITIALGVLGITGLVLGIVMSDVAAAMQQDQGTLTSLGSTKGSNEAAIEQARKSAETNKKKLDEALKKFESVGNHVPLLDKVFPQVDKSDTAAPFRFKPEYRKALDQLLEKITHRSSGSGAPAMDQPSGEELKREQEAIDDAKRKTAREMTIGVDPRGPRTTRPASARAAVPPSPPPTSPQTLVAPKGPLTREELARENAPVRASIRKARSGYCYATLNTFMLPELLGKDEAPSLEAMWYAQMMLWIEQDVVNTIAAVNQGVADKLPEKERWVGNMPIKHLVKVIVGNYVPAPAAQGARAAGGAATGAPPNDANSVFTGRGSASGVDVIQFSLDVYLNPQYMPALINAITQAGFYTPLLVNYESSSPTTELVGFIYGSNPVVHATILFEGCFLRAKYEKWMPEPVKLAVNEGRAAMGGTSASTPMGGVGGPGMGPGPGGGGFRGRGE